MKNKSIYFFELILFAFILIFKFLFIDRLAQYYEIVIIVFFLTSTFILTKIWGYRKNKTIVASNAIQLSIIITMLYFLLTYLSGLFLGFLKNSYSLSLLSVLKNTIYIAIMIISEEVIRSMVANKCNSKKLPLIVLTILYIILDIVLVFNITSVNSNLKLFIFISNTILPIIARNTLCSYLTCHVGMVPGLIYRLAISLYIYILPIIPDLGYYISSVLGVLVPFLIYMVIDKQLKDAEKKKISPIKKNMWYVNIPIFAVIIVVVALVSGMFKYQIMAIGSGSMEPVIHVGDAVIFEKFQGHERLNGEIGELLVFRHNGKFITHRIVDKYESELGEIVYKTKGDNNKEVDDFEVHIDDVIGIVKVKVSYIGLPSIWLQNLLMN